MPLDVAVIMTGLVRTMLSEPVVSSYHKHVDAVLHPDLFMVIVGDMEPGVHAQIIESYRTKAPQRGYLYRLPIEPLGLSCTPSVRPEVVEAWMKSRRAASATGGGRDDEEEAAARENVSTAFYQDVLPQWRALRHAYMNVVVIERQVRRKPYTWILRTRTDIAYFQDVPIASLSQDFAYVPMFGMSRSPRFMCQNQQIFACPRRYCRPYFMLLELFEHEECADTWGLDPITGGRRMWNWILDGFENEYRVWTPNERYAMPSTPDYDYEHRPISAEWYWLARYNDGDYCHGEWYSTECCGLVREMIYAYAVVRGTESAPMFGCHHIADESGVRESRHYIDTGSVKLSDETAALNISSQREALQRCYAYGGGCATQTVTRRGREVEECVARVDTSGHVHSEESDADAELTYGALASSALLVLATDLLARVAWPRPTLM
jgi:hypothetical protein